MEPAYSVYVMRRAIGTVLALLAACGRPAPPEVPKLVLIGGGDVPEAAWARMIELGGGRGCCAAVLAAASAEPEESARAATEALTRAGAGDVWVVEVAAAERLRTTAVLFLTGGDQNRLMAAVRGTPLEAAIRARAREGMVVAGTSAGAAAMSALMITGEGDADTLEPGRVGTDRGLGVWPEVIVDQHFVRRQRMNRLLALVLEHPDLVGVGIDEDTAVTVVGNRLDALGRGTVVVIDARGGPPARVSVLRAGDSFSVARQGS